MKKAILFLSMSLLVLVLNLNAALALTVTPPDAQAEGIALVTGSIVAILTILFSIIMLLLSAVFPILLIALSIGSIVIWVWMLIDLLQRDEKDFPDMEMKDKKIMWLLILLLTSSLGALIYYFMVYRVSKQKN